MFVTTSDVNLSMEKEYGHHEAGRTLGYIYFTLGVKAENVISKLATEFGFGPERKRDDIIRILENGRTKRQMLHTQSDSIENLFQKLWNYVL